MAQATVTAEAILETLTRVVDPAWGVNIVDLGLVYGIEAGAHHATIDMTLTAPDSPSRTSIEQQIRAMMQRRHPAITDVDIAYSWEPAWRDDFITAEGQQQRQNPIAPPPLDGEDAGITTDHVYDALMLVIDPEVGINIVDLGLIYDVAVADNDVRIEMTLTTPGCPLHASIEAAVRRTLETRHPSVGDIDLQLVWQPPWDTDRITAAGREQLGW